jgi:hypothetical protein
MLMQLFSTARARPGRLGNEGVALMPDYRPAPALSFAAVGSGRQVQIHRPGSALLVFCLGQETAKDADPIEAAVRERWPSAEDVLVAHCVDLSPVPSLFKGMAESVLVKEHAKAVDELPAGQEPYDFVVILPDWHGDLPAALKLRDVSRTLGAAVISAGGRVVWSGNSPDASAVVGHVAEAIGG